MPSEDDEAPVGGRPAGGDPSDPASVTRADVEVAPVGRKAFSDTAVRFPRRTDEPSIGLRAVECNASDRVQVEPVQKPTVRHEATRVFQVSDDPLDTSPAEH